MCSKRIFNTQARKVRKRMEGINPIINNHIKWEYTKHVTQMAEINYYTQNITSTKDTFQIPRYKQAESKTMEKIFYTNNYNKKAEVAM